jgi:predicted GNAT family N-acyltransferase
MITSGMSDDHSFQTNSPRGFSVARAEWQRDRGALRAVRRRVFVVEQGVPEALEWDEEDAHAIHLLAMDCALRPIGTARILPSGQIGRMAVVPEWRSHGVGSALLREALRIGRDSRLPPPFLNAQTSALSFYCRMGLVPAGAEFEEAGIPHVRMILADDPMTTDHQLSDRILGKGAGLVPLRDMAAIRAASIRLTEQVTRELWIFSHDLDAPIYDQQGFLDAVRRIALATGDLPVRVLLCDPEPAVRRGHRLIELARHLSSRIQIRQVPEDTRGSPEAYLIADDRGYLLRQLADSHEGSADFNAPREVRRLRRRFESIWDMAEIQQGLRRLYL